MTAEMTSCRNRNGGRDSSLSLSGGFVTYLPRLFWVFFITVEDTEDIFVIMFLFQGFEFLLQRIANQSPDQCVLWTPFLAFLGCKYVLCSEEGIEIQTSEPRICFQISSVISFRFNSSLGSWQERNSTAHEWTKLMTFPETNQVGLRSSGKGTRYIMHTWKPGTYCITLRTNHVPRVAR